MVTYLNENFEPLKNYALILTESGVSVLDISGINGLTAKIIETCTSIAGRFSGNKHAKSDSIKKAIGMIDKQIERCEEELEKASEGKFKNNLIWAAKKLIVMAPAIIMSIVICANSDKAISKIAGDDDFYDDFDDDLENVKDLFDDVEFEEEDDNK